MSPLGFFKHYKSQAKSTPIKTAPAWASEVQPEQPDPSAVRKKKIIMLLILSAGILL